MFYKEGSWLRDQYNCIRCKSIPRWRALITVLNDFAPNWRRLTIHESSPSGSTYRKLRTECTAYHPTHYFPDRQTGNIYNGFRCENLCKQTFSDEMFDIVITQDIFEHIFNPELAFKEIHRTLKPGGMHIFTMPWYYEKQTQVRAKLQGNSIIHLLEPDYHLNPIDNSGSLVVTDWGDDLCDFIYEYTKMSTTVIRLNSRRLGIDGKFLEVFVSRKRR